MLQHVLIGMGLAVVVAVFVVSRKALRGLYDHTYQVPGILFSLSSCFILVFVKYVMRGCKPRFVEWTLEAEITQAIMRYVTTHYLHRIVKPENAAYIRQMMENTARESSEATAREADVSIQYFTFNGHDHVWHRIRELLTRELGYDVCVEFLLANYREAPQFPYPRPPQDAYAMYKFLLDEEKLSPSQIMVMGDSAGGGLTMTTLLRARDEDPSLVPAAAILSCAYVDRSYKGDDRESPYCVLTADAVETYLNRYHSGEGDPKTWGDASPIDCDLRQLPPVYIQAAEFDHLLPHSKRLYAKAIQDGLTTWRSSQMCHTRSRLYAGRHGPQPPRASTR